MTVEHVALKALPEDKSSSGARQSRSRLFMEYSAGSSKSRKEETVLLASIFPLARQQATLECELLPEVTYKFFMDGPRYFFYE